MLHLYYIHDPMCSWCYAFNPVLQRIEHKLPKAIRLVKIVGGLAADSMDPMPESLAAMIQMNWKKIELTVPGIKFNFDFWKNNQAIRSTYPSCRAVLAAKSQSTDFENKMISQIQYSYYQNGENPSLDKTLINCAKTIGLDSRLFISDFHSQQIDDQLQQQIAFSKSMGVSSYPSLCLETDQKTVPIGIDYNNTDLVMSQILSVSKEKNYK